MRRAALAAGLAALVVLGTTACGGGSGPAENEVAQSSCALAPFARLAAILGGKATASQADRTDLEVNGLRTRIWSCSVGIGAKGQALHVYAQANCGTADQLDRMYASELKDARAASDQKVALPPKPYPFGSRRAFSQVHAFDGFTTLTFMTAHAVFDVDVSDHAVAGPLPLTVRLARAVAGFDCTG